MSQYVNQFENALKEIQAKLPPGYAVAPIKTDVTYAHTVVSVSPGSIPPRKVKKAFIAYSNVQLENPGTLWVMLGRAASIPLPFINPPASISGVLDIFSGESGDCHLQIDEFTLSQPISAGSVILVCVV